MLSDDIIKITAQREMEVVICGDMNARCGTLQDYIVKDDTKHNHDILWWNSDEFEQQRRSKDEKVNNFGKELVELCIALNMHIVNGRTQSDKDGEFTLCSQAGKSVIDYCLCSTELFKAVEDFEVKLLDISDKESDHFPCELIIRCTNMNPRKQASETAGNIHCYAYEKITWNPMESANYYENLCTEEVAEILDKFDVDLEQGDINEAVLKFEDVVKSAAGNMVKKYKPSVSKRNEEIANVPWWDNDLAQCKRQRNAALGRYRRNKNTEHLDEYLELKRKFRSMYSNKKVEFNEAQCLLVQDCMHDKNRLWSLVRKINQKSAVSRNNITPEQWYDYYQGLLNQENEIDPENVQDVTDYLMNHDHMCQTCVKDVPKALNDYITQAEICRCMRDMTIKKAPGIDGIVIEAVLKGENVLVPKLENLFNKIMNSGIYPERWSRAILCSLHKGGDIDEPGNYRGISLLSVIGKIFTKVLNERLVQWAKENGECYEEQAGYKKGYSTVDQIFNLHALGQKYLSRKGGRFYVMYVDFSKAFDRIPHKMLWFQMFKRGIHGKIMDVLRSMYGQLKSCIRLENNCVTEYFDCCVGTRQGCMLSPFLFTFYLNELIEQINEKGGKGIFVDEVWHDVKILLYADDIILCADTVGNLQAHINVLKVFCDRWGMKVNLKKTKIMVFRRGGQLRRCEKWYFGDQKIEIVPQYTYLGVRNSTQLSWGAAQYRLSVQAQKNLAVVYRFQQAFKNVPFTILLELFDKMVCPVLVYGAEVWGYSEVKCIERIQTKFCKRILGLSKNACNMAALGECGRNPLKVAYFSRCIKYWLKVCTLPENRLNKRCYLMLKRYDEMGRKTWATHIKHLLYTFGFGYVWEEQGVGDVEAFIHIFKQTVTDCSGQEWSSEINSMSKTSLLACIKRTPCQEVYTAVLRQRYLRGAMARLRCGNHSLMIEKGRYDNTPRAERKCLLCESNQIEDEEHFVMYCAHFSELRERYISKHLVSNNSYGFIKLLTTNNKNALFDFSNFLFIAFKKRDAKLAEQTTN